MHGLRRTSCEPRPRPARDPRLPGLPRLTTRGRRRQRAGVHRLRAGLPGARRHPGPAGGRGAAAWFMTVTGTVFDESRLDGPALLAEGDAMAVLRAAATAGAQVRESRQLAVEAGVDQMSRGGAPRAAVVLTDGPVAAVLGDLLHALAGPEAVAPVTTVCGGPLPPWVGPLDIAFVVSYRGIDAATLGAVEMAARRGVPLLGAGPADTPLHDAVASLGRSPYVGLPLREPRRASFWSLATPMLLGAGRAGLIRLPDSDLAVTADILDEVAERCRPTS